jgi:ABC-type glycerol-3-phosphate transport system permease component
MDGCSRLEVISRMLLPLFYRAVIRARLNIFLSAWHESLFSVVPIESGLMAECVTEWNTGMRARYPKACSRSDRGRWDQACADGSR